MRYLVCDSPLGKPNRFRRPAATSTEFAIVGLAFFVIVPGIFEVGRLIMVKHLLTNAARQGCRAGVLQGVSSTTITNVTTQALTAQGVNSSTATVQVNDGSTDASSAQSGDEITVLVSVSTANISWVPFAQYLSGTVSGQYTLRRE
jgi:Flp pilus assembly protein TadG